MRYPFGPKCQFYYVVTETERAGERIEELDSMGKLWRHGDFTRLWAGETVEWVTDSISTLAVPTIAIRTFNAGPLDMGILTSLGYVAYPFLGLFAGVLVDRWRRRPVLVWTNVIQFVALGSIPVAFFLGDLSLYQLFIVTLVMGVTIVFFEMAYTSYLPTLIARGDLVEGNSKLETSTSGAVVVGPGIAGALIHVIGAAPSVTIDAFGTLFAAFSILSIQKGEDPQIRTMKRHFWRELREGLQSVSGNALLRNIAAATSILNLGNSMFWAVLYLFIYDQLKMSTLTAGITLAVGAIGSMIGAIAAPKLLNRLGLGGALTAALLINGVGYLTVRASIYGPTAVTFAGLWLLANLGLPIYNISQISLRQTIVADALQGRMNATLRTFGYGAATVGALTGGILGARFGILTAMTTGALVSLIASIVVHFGPIGKIKHIPKPGDPTQIGANMPTV